MSHSPGACTIVLFARGGTRRRFHADSFHLFFQLDVEDVPARSPLRSVQRWAELTPANLRKKAAERRRKEKKRRGPTAWFVQGGAPGLGKRR